MHAHVSLGISGPKYTPTDLIQVLKAISYFDDPITRIMPPDRKSPPWARSNMMQDQILPLYQDVSSGTWAGLFSYFEQIQSVDQVYDNIFGWDRAFSWNFDNVFRPCGKIEFRRPPGVRDAKKAKHWVVFALAFIRHAPTTNWDHVRYTTTGPGVGELTTFLSEGVAILERECRGALRLGMLEEDYAAPTVYTSQELGAMMQKKLAKTMRGSTFAESVRSLSKEYLLAVMIFATAVAIWFRTRANPLILGKFKNHLPSVEW